MVASSSTPNRDTLGVVMKHLWLLICEQLSAFELFLLHIYFSFKVKKGTNKQTIKEICTRAVLMFNFSTTKV